ncbi:MAG: hypothetical protein EXS67_01525 [Candidatus Margulisbacteria bacterium]|nr:hypothetical protein [Candidatus Margulisiibacteriota bacterium]
MKNSILFLLVIATILTTQAQALLAAPDTVAPMKISTNVVTLIGLGDLNLNFEKPSGDSSFLFGGHINADKSNRSILGDGGIYTSLRVYMNTYTVKEFGQASWKTYVQGTFGASFADKLSPSAELWIGATNGFGGLAFQEIGIGIGRIFNDKSPMHVAIGYNIGLSI